MKPAAILRPCDPSRRPDQREAPSGRLSYNWTVKRLCIVVKVENL
jgi:hypothetical protein